ncbi:hypothetical protein QOZ80_1AG0039970 [Eleusine coracana subsp. coracana]|nr:hypothetical protein QOZ80_1AG0039970 [Eleusine coracana subsp. coracana]
MECNKDEADRAKSLAERKMVEKDFIGAKKMILKAQQLSKELDNISSRMLAVCDVHSAAGAKVNGEIDWYGILQVPVNADDTVIKKQYRKLAFLLHPDKNKFAGAEAAFKLVGEANMTLIDPSKRSLYDMNRNRNILVRGGVARPSRPAAARARGTPVNLHKAHQQQQHQTSNFAGPQQTFWTICPSCGLRYQYYLSVLKRAIQCQNCLKPFIAHDLNEQAVPSGANQRSAGVWKNAGSTQNVPPSQANVPGQPAWNSSTSGVHVNIGSHHVNVNRKRKADGKAAEQDKMKSARATKNPAKDSSTAGQKRGRRAVVESSVSSEAETTSDEEEIVDQGPAANSTGPGQQTRRSSRHRQEVKYNEESDEDDIEAESSKDGDDSDENIASPPSFKRLRKSGLFHGDHINGTTKLNEDVSGHNGPTNGVNDCSNAEVKNNDGAPCGEKTSVTQQMKRETMQVGDNSDGKEKVFHSVSDGGLDPNNDDASDDNKFDDTFSFADPEFFDFDKLRSKDQFRRNQIWAVYDDDGCMPRFYVRITKVQTNPNFMVHYVWLEFDPKNKMEAAWHNRGLPVACGCFKHGKSDTSKETSMFSRTISFDEGKRRNTYEIYPRKGEVWALFKGWNIGWNLDAEKHRKYEYEVVEVLSDLTSSTSIIAMPLVKIKGFISLFMQPKEAAPYVIPQGESLRFSHCVPHHRMSGTEREGIPEGSLELDPAGLPCKLEESFPSVAPECSSAKTQECDTRHAGPSSAKSPHKGSVSARERQDTTCMNAETVAKTPMEETSGHKTETRLLQKFSVGQIWALYSDVDTFPNYYGVVHKVDLKNDILQIRWLNACPQGEQEKRLLQEERPIACGAFKVSDLNDMMTYSSTDAFSHPVEARTTGKNEEYEIIPNLGEIWAVYKNWSTGWTAQDYEKCEYELVEIFGHTESSTEVKLLRKLDGYNVVFMPCKGEESVKTIRKDEYLKFSHQIPCFHLTDENGCKLRGALELDPFSVPKEFLPTSSK